jgi:hypothetical protein
MIEDGEDEENDDNYPVFPKYGDAAMEDNEEEGGDEQTCIDPLMILVGSFSMQSEIAKQKRRGCSLSRCHRTTDKGIANRAR